ncbi:uncharacterized protein SPSC_03363 [Sporisorium scitamineum]|uniref:Uncharacterized protein n=2 Tax=Sporisorium scitamineum TaxID=49012 RepID=A0A127ZE93_9BASI|nr:uncharacterized protein SPSC_03363 [Sporisorium scitamineum]
MFLPRKLQKRTHAGRSAQSDAVSSVAQQAKRDVAQLKPSDEIAQQEATAANSSSAWTSTYATPQAESPSPTPNSKPETAKLDRLVEFLYTQLSPLVAPLTHHTDQSTPNHLFPASPQNRPPTPIHLARLLTHLPHLATRCKSIHLLSQALHILLTHNTTTAAAAAAAGNWFVLHRDAFCLEWSPRYMRVVSEVGCVDGVGLGKLLVYVEAIPARVRTRVEAAGYLNGLLMGEGEGEGEGGMVLGVMEPGVVEGWMMGGQGVGLVGSMLGGKWTSGRGFFVLDSCKHVEVLCRTYSWDLSQRPNVKPLEPIRCLSWSEWVTMRKLYHRRQKLMRPSPSDTQPQPDHTNSQPDSSLTLLPEPAHSNCYRGTILLLLPFPHLAPALLNRHLKPQLEKRVAESISYIHPFPTTNADSATTTSTIVIRTAHPILAAQLLLHFPELTRMQPDQEDSYWSTLPRKTRHSARRRVLTLSSTTTNV